MSGVGACLGNKQRTNTFVNSNVIYDPLVWNFTTSKGINESEKVLRKKSQVYIKWLWKKMFSIVGNFEEAIYGGQKTSKTDIRTF